MSSNNAPHPTQRTLPLTQARGWWGALVNGVPSGSQLGRARQVNRWQVGPELKAALSQQLQAIARPACGPVVTELCQLWRYWLVTARRDW
jgi:hypothetical protein